MDLKEALPPIAASLSPSNTFIEATLKSKEPAVGGVKIYFNVFCDNALRRVVGLIVLLGIHIFIASILRLIS